MTHEMRVVHRGAFDKTPSRASRRTTGSAPPGLTIEALARTVRCPPPACGPRPARASVPQSRSQGVRDTVVDPLRDRQALPELAPDEAAVVHYLCQGASIVRVAPFDTIGW